LILELANNIRQAHNMMVNARLVEELNILSEMLLVELGDTRFQIPQQTPKKKKTTVLDTPVHMEIGNDFVEVIHDSKGGTAFFTNLCSLMSNPNCNHHRGLNLLELNPHLVHPGESCLRKITGLFLGPSPF